jgi:hypothetical protein
MLVARQGDRLAGGADRDKPMTPLGYLPVDVSAQFLFVQRFVAKRSH